MNTSLTQKFLFSLQEEAKVRKNYLQNEAVETIYFGGGTPSVLKINELEDILAFIKTNFLVSESAEITFEANPDDLSAVYLEGLKTAGINRLSIGIQSFQDAHLQKMNRRHSSIQAINAIEDAVRLGFYNLSVDLIYGLPGLSEKEWKESLSTVFQLPVQHLSAYHLTYHEGTAFFTWLKKGTLKELSETESVRQFNQLIDEAEKAGFEQYEISNFARGQKYSRHNTAYWQGTSYLGLGPSAHSYDRKSRRWNVSHVESYIKGIEKGNSYFEEEILSEKDRYNEYILTSIRTKWGVDLKAVENEFGQAFKNNLVKQIEKYLKSGNVLQNNNVFTLSKNGLFISDEIMSELMII